MQNGTMQATGKCRTVRRRGRCLAVSLSVCMSEPDCPTAGLPDCLTDDSIRLYMPNKHCRTELWVHGRSTLLRGRAYLLTVGAHFWTVGAYFWRSGHTLAQPGHTYWRPGHNFLVGGRDIGIGGRDTLCGGRGTPLRGRGTRSGGWGALLCGRGTFCGGRDTTSCLATPPRGQKRRVSEAPKKAPEYAPNGRAGALLAWRRVWRMGKRSFRKGGRAITCAGENWVGWVHATSKQTSFTFSFPKYGCDGVRGSPEGRCCVGGSEGAQTDQPVTSGAQEAQATLMTKSAEAPSEELPITSK
eukprot:gene22526-biopygen5760